MDPSPFSYGIWSDVHQEFIAWERQRTPEEDAECRGKLPVIRAGKRVKYEPMFDTDGSSFFPCILHIMMICGKLMLGEVLRELYHSITLGPRLTAWKMGWS